MKTHNKYLKAIRQSYSTLFAFVAAACSMSVNAQYVNPIDMPYDVYPDVSNDTIAPYSYRGKINYEMPYTYHENIYMGSSGTMAINITTRSNGITPSPTFYNYKVYAYIFNTDNPASYSMTLVSRYASGQIFSALNVPAGNYTIVVTTDNKNSIMRNITINGQTRTSCIINNCFIPCSLEADIPYHTFTCNTVNSSHMNPMILMLDTGIEGKVIASNDDGGQTGSINWHSNSYIYKSFDTPVNGLIAFNRVSSHALPVMCTPIPQTDLYIGCRDISEETSSAISLFTGTAMLSSDIDNEQYDSFAWAAGMWDCVLNPSSVLFGNKFTEDDRIEYLDSIYSAAGFTRTGATDEDCCIKVYGKVNKKGVMSFKHAMIRKNNKEFAHGYGWESKLGLGNRIFHTEGSLQAAHGDVIYRYKNKRNWIFNDSCLNFQERFERENVPFNSNETDMIDEIIGDELTASEVAVFNTIYSNAKQYMSEHALTNEDRFDNPFYLQLISKCASKEECIFIAYKHLTEGDQFAVNLIEDISLVSYSEFLTAMRLYNNSHMTAPNGKTILRTPFSNASRLVKMILEEDYMNSSPAVAKASYSSEEDAFSLSVSGHDIELSLDLQRNSKVSVYLTALDRQQVSYPVRNISLQQGKQSVSITAPIAGMYLVTCNINGCIYTKKIKI